jgi:hypothetical protein
MKAITEHVCVNEAGKIYCMGTHRCNVDITRVTKFLKLLIIKDIGGTQ